MKKLEKIISLLIILTFVMMFTAACGQSADGDKNKDTAMKDIMFVSGPQGGAWYALSASLSEVLMKQIAGLRVTANEGGSVGNVRAVNKGVDAQMGLTWSAFYQDGKQGINSYEKDGKLDNIRPIAAIQTNYIYIVTTVDKKINELKDLIGKKVVPGAVASGGEFTFKGVLNAAGITYDDIKKGGGDVIFTDYGEAATLIKDGQIDAFVLTGPAKHNLLMDIQTVKKIKVIPIPEDVLKKFTTEFPGFGYEEFPASVYDGQSGSILTPVSYTTVVVNKDLPDELVEQITKSIIENRATFELVHKDFSFISKENAVKGFDKAELHPGAKKYYGF